MTDEYENVAKQVGTSPAAIERRAYKKLSATLATLDPSGIDSLVSTGTLVTYTPSDSGFTRKANPSLMAKKAFESGIDETFVHTLPKGTVEHELLGISYYIVADDTVCLDQKVNRKELVCFWVL